MRQLQAAAAPPARCLQLLLFTLRFGRLRKRAASAHPCCCTVIAATAVAHLLSVCWYVLMLKRVDHCCCFSSQRCSRYCGYCSVLANPDPTTAALLLHCSHRSVLPATAAAVLHCCRLLTQRSYGRCYVLSLCKASPTFCPFISYFVHCSGQ